MNIYPEHHQPHKRGRDPVFKCIYCGKYIADADIGTDKIKEQFIPDTEFTTEEQLFWHRDCEK